MKKTIILLILSILTSCANYPVQVTKPLPSTQNTPVPQTLPTPEVKPEIKPEATPNPSAIPTIQPSVTITPSSTPVLPQVPYPSAQIPHTIDTDTYVPPFSGIPNPNFSTNDPVSEGIRDSSLSIFFKDPAIIRLGFENGKYFFISKAGADVSNINNIMKEYNITTIYSNYSALGKTEEELAEKEKASEAFFGVDIPNQGSIYSLSLKNTNIKELIEKIRKDPNVLSSNESKTGTTA